MNREKLFSREGFSKVDTFLNNNPELPYIIKNEINNVSIGHYNMGYKTRRNTFIISNDEISAIAIINKENKDCYIYTNCGLDFNINEFFEFLLDHQKDFTKITMEEILYERFKNEVDEDDIFHSQTEVVYQQITSNILRNNLENEMELKLFSLDKKIKDNVLENMVRSNLYKIIDDHYIYIIGSYGHFMIYVENSNEFTNKYFDIIDDNYSVGNLENKFCEDNGRSGYKVRLKNFALINSLKSEINSLVFLVAYSGSLDIKMLYVSNEIKGLGYLNNGLKLIIKQLGVYDDDKVFYYSTSRVSPSYMRELDFKKSYSKKRLYLYNGNATQLISLDHFKQDVKIEGNVPLGVVLIIFSMFMHVIYFGDVRPYLLMEFNNNNLYDIIFTSCYLFVFTSLYLTIKTYRMYFRERKLKNYYWSPLSRKGVFSIIVIIIIISMMIVN